MDPSVKPASNNVFLDVIPYIRAVPVMASWVDIESTVGEELERAYYGQIDVDEFVAVATERTQKYFGD